MRRRLLLGALASAFVAGPRRGRAEAELRVIVPELLTADSGTAMRILQPFLEPALGHPLTIDFRPGAGGILGLTLGAHAAPDGMTLTVLTPAVTLAPWLSRRMDCSPTDFTLLGQISFAPAVLVVRADAPWKTLSDLLGSRGQSLAVPAPWDWQPAQMAQAMFLSRTGLAHRALTTPRSDAERLEAVLSREADLAFVGLEHARKALVSKELKPLAISGPARLTGFPDVPTLRESGIEVSIGAWRILAAPASSPDALLAPLASAFGYVIARPEVRDALAAAGLMPAWQSGSEAAPRIAAEYREAGQLFSALGLNVRGEPQQALRG
jgi:tripartite-type tricarboxylate transporter receptor subunit TctC